MNMFLQGKEPAGGIETNWRKTEETCTTCEEPLRFAEEVAQVGISHAFHNGREVIVIPLLQEEGDYSYEPHFLDFNCFENLGEQLREMVKDAPPIKHEEALLYCDYCDCAICEWEIFGTVYLGEIHVSPRKPYGYTIPTFVSSSPDPYVICIGCLLLLNEHEVELWDQEDLNQVGECSECTHARCWRNEGCSCQCHERNESEKTSRQDPVLGSRARSL